MIALQIEIPFELEIKLRKLAQRQGKTVDGLIIDMLTEQTLVNEVRENFTMSTGMVRFKESK